MADTGVIDPPLSQGVAYGIVLGFGIVFALTMNLITWVSRKYLFESTVSIYLHCQYEPLLTPVRTLAC